jgi:hypothetical protein
MIHVPVFADSRKLLRNRYPFLACYCVFIALIVLLPYPNIYRNFFYVTLLIPLLLVLNRNDCKRLAHSRMVWTVFAYALTLSLSLIWNPPKELAQSFTLIRHILIALSFVGMTAWLMAENPHYLHKLIRWFGWVVLLMAVISLWKFYSINSLNERFVAGYWSNSNTGGAIFGLTVVAIASSTANTWANGGRNTTDIIIGLVACACVVLTGSRAALVAIIVSVLTCFAAARYWRPLAWSVVVGMILIALAFLFKKNELVEHIVRLNSSGRAELWFHYWQIARERLWTGHGISNEFAFQYDLVRGPEVQVLDNPHNMLLSTVLYAGLPAALAYIALIVALLTCGIIDLRRSGAMVTVALSVYIIVHGLFEAIVPVHLADWQWIYFWMPIGIAAAAELNLNQSARIAVAGG